MEWGLNMAGINLSNKGLGTLANYCTKLLEGLKEESLSLKLHECLPELTHRGSNSDHQFDFLKKVYAHNCNTEFNQKAVATTLPILWYPERWNVVAENPHVNKIFLTRRKNQNMSKRASRRPFLFMYLYLSNSGQIYS